MNFNSNTYNELQNLEKQFSEDIKLKKYNNKFNLTNYNSTNYNKFFVTNYDLSPIKEDAKSNNENDRSSSMDKIPEKIT